MALPQRVFGPFSLRSIRKVELSMETTSGLLGQLVRTDSDWTSRDSGALVCTVAAEAISLGRRAVFGWTIQIALNSITGRLVIP